MHDPEILPVRRNVAGFLEQLAFCGIDNRFPGIDFPGRQFEKHTTQGIAELSLENQVAVIKKGENDDRPRMDDVLADRFLAIGKADAVLANFQQRPLEDGFGGDFRLDKVGIVAQFSLSKDNAPHGCGASECHGTRRAVRANATGRTRRAT